MIWASFCLPPSGTGCYSACQDLISEKQIPELSFPSHFAFIIQVIMNSPVVGCPDTLHGVRGEGFRAHWLDVTLFRRLESVRIRGLFILNMWQDCCLWVLLTAQKRSHLIMSTGRVLSKPWSSERGSSHKMRCRGQRQGRLSDTLAPL